MMGILAMAAAATAAAAPAAGAGETPRQFAMRLYAGYRDPNFSPLKRPERVFAPALVAAIREEARLSRGEVGFMDADPICDCQDPSGLRPSIGVARQTGASAQVRVALRFGAGGEVRNLKLKLIRTVAGWRIADLSNPDEPSLLADLTAWNRAHRRRR
ncbi:MAG: DUF3828 domain-containing protein [Alphaproteobacteria bacterium]|nr:DUF3828 domain-containing protein [Alphaproteobacteria bacterium]